MDIAIVIPVYNEAENVLPLLAKIKEALKPLKKSYEIIFVDDGSTDDTSPLLKETAQKNPELKVVRFRRNFGQAAAISCGFKLAQGEVIVTMDGDLQNDPQDIPRLLKKMEEGYDLVSGWRKDRRDPLITRKIPSWVANWLISQITGVKLHDYGCTLKAYRKNLLKDINLYGEIHRFLPALISWQGIAIAEIPVQHYSRRAGRSKYNLSRILTTTLDLITTKFLLSYSHRPIQIFGSLGLVLGGVGFVIGLYLSFIRLALRISIAGRPLLLLSVGLVIAGLQFIIIGLIGEMLMRIYYESAQKTPYAIKETVNI